jgi:hypothetical protein
VTLNSLTAVETTSATVPAPSSFSATTSQSIPEHFKLSGLSNSEGGF